MNEHFSLQKVNNNILLQTSHYFTIRRFIS